MLDIIDLRKKVDNIDLQVIKLLLERFSITDEIGKRKKEDGLLIEDKNREQEIIENIKDVVKNDIKSENIIEIYKEIFKLSKKNQDKKL